jgi:hypothetical protein
MEIDRSMGRLGLEIGRGVVEAKGHERLHWKLGLADMNMGWSLDGGRLVGAQRRPSAERAARSPTYILEGGRLK